MRLRRTIRHPAILVPLVVFGVIVLVEAYTATFQNLYWNFYWKSVYRAIRVKRTENVPTAMFALIVLLVFYFMLAITIPDLMAFSSDYAAYESSNSSEIGIAIVTILKDQSNYGEYLTAQNLFKCYAIHLATEGGEQDTGGFMFRRHCVLAEIMEELDSEWVLFIDADMAVINPDHLIEEWIDENYNLVFYLRIFNFEIMAGSYLARNTPYSRRFLHYWADYEFRLPNSFHGTDNGAIHSALFDLLYPERRKEHEHCKKFWKQSRSYTDLAIYETCIQYLLGPKKSWPGQIKILGKTKSWARDTWLTNSMWSNRDFLLHGWKRSRMNAAVFAGWPSPLVTHDLEMSLCNYANVKLNWQYKDLFIKSDQEIETILGARIESVEKSFQNVLNQTVLKSFRYFAP